MKLIPKNWTEFQQYKDRSPPWIKLHRKLLDDYDFYCLPVASKALAPMLWLLASEEKDGAIEGSLRSLAFRLHMTESELAEALNPLVESKFFDLEQDAIEPLADCKRDACPETETETQVQTEKIVAKRVRDARSEKFEEFWKAYPKTPVMSKKQAKAEWEKLPEPLQSAALAAVAPFKEWLAKQKDHPIVHACRFLSQRRFEGFEASAPVETIPGEFLVKRYSQDQTWRAEYGPEPGKPGCRASPEVLAKFGYEPKAA